MLVIHKEWTSGKTAQERLAKGLVKCQYWANAGQNQPNIKPMLDISWALKVELSHNLYTMHTHK